MKTKILLVFFIFYTGICFSQVDKNFQTDKDGRTTYTPTSHSSDQKNNYFKPYYAEFPFDWGEEVGISNHPTFDSWDPRMTLDAEGNVYIVYNDNTTESDFGLQKVLLRKKMGDGEWTEAIIVDQGEEVGERNNHKPAIEVSPNGDLHVIYSVWSYLNGRDHLGYSRYNAATDTWEEGIKISDIEGTIDHTMGRPHIVCTQDNLPVAVWDYDNRNNGNENIYLTYFDGEKWSEDIPVSDISTNHNNGFVAMKGLTEQKSMIVFSEHIEGIEWHLKCRVYDKNTHALSPIKTIATEHILGNNYTLATTDSGSGKVLVIYKNDSNQDIMKVYNYDPSIDSFEVSSHSYIMDTDLPQLVKTISMDCLDNGECAIVYTNLDSETVNYIGYNDEDGFKNNEVLVNENPYLDPATTIFDPEGNLNIVWSDLRNSDSPDVLHRDVFYKEGINRNLDIDKISKENIQIYPNPSTGIFTINTHSQNTYKVKIFDILGELVDVKSINGTAQIEENLAPGTYFLHLKNGRQITVKKLIIE